MLGESDEFIACATLSRKVRVIATAPSAMSAGCTL